MVEFRAPEAALYRVNGQFYGLDANGTATQTNVSIWKQDPTFSRCGASLVYAGAFRLLGAPQLSLQVIERASFSSTFVMRQKNHKPYFEVAPGPNDNIQFGSTGLHAVIQRAGNYRSGVSSGSDC